VDFEQGLNYAIRRFEVCLKTTPKNPFVETLPKRGYRFHSND